MAEVGVLNLTIKDNSEQAAQGLGTLVDALKRVKGAVKNGLDMSGVAKGIESFGKAVDDSIHGSTLSKISQLTESLSKMSGMGPIHIHIKDTGVEDTAKSFSGIQKSSKSVKTDLESVASAISKVKNAAAGGIGGHGMAGIARSLTSAATNLESSNVAGVFKKVAAAIIQYADAYERLNMMAFVPNNMTPGRMKPNLSQFGEDPKESIEGIKQVASEVQETVAESINESSTEVIQSVQSETQQAMESISGLGNASDVVKTATDNAAGFTAAVSDMKKETDAASESQMTFGERIRKSASNLKDAIPKFSALHKVLRLASTMLIRMGLRALFKGIKEGLNNYYLYSKKIGGTFAEDMNNVYSAWTKLKNQMGASLAPVLTAALPIINSIANAAIHAFNAISQLFALLSGKNSWSAATEQAMDYGDAIGGAGGKMKELLAQFDELNVISSESGGGGGGGAAGDVANMFEEMYEFDERIRAIVDFIKENMESIKGMAIAIGTAILAWKLADAFAETLPMLSKLAALIGVGAVIALELQATWVLTNEYLDTGKIGWLIADVFATAVGSVAAWGIAQHFIGGNAGAWAASILLTFSALTGIKAVVDNADVGTLSKESIVTLLESALKAGAAAGILLKTVGNSTMLVAAQGAAGVALVVFGAAVGIKAICDDNIEVFSQESVESGIISAASVGLGLAVLGVGPVIAAGAAIATFFAYIGIKALTSANKITVDNNLVSLTDEQVKAFVEKKMFSIEPQIMIDVISKNLDLAEGASKRVEDKLKEIMGTLNVVKLGLANEEDYTTLKSQITGEGGLIDSIVGWINEAENTSKLVLKFTPQLVGSSEEEQSDWYTGDIEGWETIKTFVTERGAELARLMVDGEISELKGERLKRVNAILDEINTIANIVAGTDIKTETLIDFELKLKDLDQSSLNEALRYFNTVKEDMRKVAIEMEETAIANKQRMIYALEEMLKLDPNNAELQAQLEEARTALQTMKENFQNNVDETFGEILKPGQSMLQEWLNSNFNPGSISMPWDEDTVRDMLDIGGLEDTLGAIFTDAGFDMNLISVNELIQVGGWDLLEADLQTNILKYAVMNPSTLSELKDKFKLTASDLINIENWDSFSASQKLNYINAIVDAFGSEAALQAAKDAGINVATLLEDGLRHSDTEGVAKEIVDKLGAEVSKGEVTVPDVSTPDGFFDKVKKSASDKVKESADLIKKQKLEVKDATVPSKFFDAVKNKIKDKVVERQNWMKGRTLVVKDATVPNKFFDSVKNKIKDKVVERQNWMKKQSLTVKDASTPGKFFSSVKDTIQTKFKDSKTWLSNQNLKVPDATISSSATQDAKNALSGVISDLQDIANDSSVKIPVGVKPDGSSVTTHISGGGTGGGTVTVMAKALGGFVETGSLFLAGEAGPELVGTMNGRSAVANQDQIVDGISKGVYDANAEQNGLLREQNNLLRAILAKETNVNIGASASFGRAAKKSIAMYDAMVGG